MSNFSSAQYTLDNPSSTLSGDLQMRHIARAQARATLALVEAQETANLIAFLNWAEGKGNLVSTGEYIKMVKQVKERIK